MQALPRAADGYPNRTRARLSRKLIIQLKSSFPQGRVSFPQDGGHFRTNKRILRQGQQSFPQASCGYVENFLCINFVRSKKSQRMHAERDVKTAPNYCHELETNMRRNMTVNENDYDSKKEKKPKKTPL